VVICVALIAGAPTRECRGEVAFDFETGDLQGWTVVEGRFDDIISNRQFFHNRPQVKYNKQGNCFLTTLEMSNGRPNDRMTGVIESPVFVLRGGKASFLVGGGAHPDTYVALCTENGKEVLKAHGKNTEVMQHVEWDTSSLRGKKVFLRIVDRNTGSWGHVTFDNFRADGEIDRAATVARAAARERRRREDGMRERMRSLRADITSLRRAVTDLVETFRDRYPRGKVFLAALDEIERRSAKAPSDRAAQLAAELDSLKRQALVANPLLTRQPILFVVRSQYLPDHHNTATLFQAGEINAQKFRGGSALKTIDFAREGKVETIIEAPNGVLRDPEVHFDGRRILFSMRRNGADDYHIYEVGVDGTGLKQLTFGRGASDIDPFYLPDGRIVFTSTRDRKFCMCNRHIMGNLFRMDAGGRSIHQIGRNTLFEGHGFLMPDGRILYDRWEYVDRNFGDAQGLWTCNPDGTNHALYWGNNTKAPGGVIDARAIPGTHRVVCIFTSCHDRPWGAMAVLDNSLGMEGRDPVIRTWPAAAVSLVRAGWGQGGYLFDVFKKVRPKYEDPYPLSDKYFLCSRMTGKSEQMGIYLVDVFGNEVLVHVEGPGCFDPMPVCPRPSPPIIPDRINLDRKEGAFYVYDVCVGTGMERVKRGTVRYLRVVESPKKTYWTRPAWLGQGQEAPAMNWDNFINKRILGTVPVEEDGSVYFTIPADRFVFFQLLDENGMMIQSMRSGTMVRPGETTACVGCHEGRNSAVPNHSKAALGRPPRKLTPWYGPPRNFGYAAEVQPVFDKYCIRCHDYEKPGAEKLLLAGGRSLAFSVSYNQLWRKKIINAVGAGPADILPPYSWGSHVSRLVDVIRSGHNDVKLDKESFDRIVTWIDINGPYYPFYESAYPDNLFGRSPLDDRQLRRLSELTGVDFLKRNKKSYQETEWQVDFTRPELSMCLAKFTDKNDPKYKEALAIIRAGAAMLAKRPRMDMPGAKPAGIDVKRTMKYGAPVRAEKEGRRGIVAGKPTREKNGGDDRSLAIHE